MEYVIELTREQHTTFTCEASSLDEAFDLAELALLNDSLENDWHTYDYGYSMEDATDYYSGGMES